MAQKPIRVGIIGAGYIASWHADALRATPQARLTAVCDLSHGAAMALAEAHGAQVFTDVDALIAADICDMVHILTPPQMHHDLAVQCLENGLNVLVEKPVALSADETRSIATAADSAGKRFVAGHNFLGLPSYLRLKSQMQDGTLGRVASAEINWCLPLAPLRSGPYGLWLLREPRNLLLELGPHPFAFAVDLFGVPEITHLELSKPVALPGNDMRAQGWRILGHAGDVALTFNLSLVETLDNRSVTLRGSSGMARMDYAQDRLIVTRENASDLVLNPLRQSLDLSWQHLREGLGNAGRQLTSLNAKSPYGLSFRGMSGSVYDSMAGDMPVDARFAADSAVTVMQAIDDALALLPKDAQQPKAPAVQTRKPKPRAMVIGGTGFIGRHLTRSLVAQGTDVRVLSRGRTGPFPDLPDQVETCAVDLYDRDALTASMKGIDVVYNLAKSMDKTWEDALRNDVGVTMNIAHATQLAGVQRLVYTGTIASYDMSKPTGKITEDTPFGDMTSRNMYARSKAECERQLMQMHEADGLPLVIARPGIVIGPGGPLQHWGIGRWHGAGAVRIWGNGRNILPFVLIDDVSDALIRMGSDPAAIGQSYNITGARMLSARGYFDAIYSALGARIRVSSGNIHAFHASDAVKHVLKKHALRRTGLSRASLADWKSRAHLTPFDNSKLIRDLDWQPETDISTFIERGITRAGLFGF